MARKKTTSTNGKRLSVEALAEQYLSLSDADREKFLAATGLAEMLGEIETFVREMAEDLLVRLKGLKDEIRATLALHAENEQITSRLLDHLQRKGLLGPTQPDVYQRITELAAAGKSGGQIAKLLKADGKLTSKGKAWTDSNIRGYCSRHKIALSGGHGGRPQKN